MSPVRMKEGIDAPADSGINSNKNVIFLASGSGFVFFKLVWVSMR